MKSRVAPTGAENEPHALVLASLAESTPLPLPPSLPPSPVLEPQDIASKKTAEALHAWGRGSHLGLCGARRIGASFCIVKCSARFGEGGRVGGLRGGCSVGVALGSSHCVSTGRGEGRLEGGRARRVLLDRDRSV